MGERHRLPISVLVLLAVALLGLGAGWWIRAAPEQPAAATRAAVAPGSVLLLRLDDGRVYQYQRGRPGPLQWLTNTYFPCTDPLRQPMGEVPGARFSPCARGRG
jgi:hypothetical protein